MGQVADWLMQGGGCEWCGVMVGDGTGGGFPRLCPGCADEAREQGYEVNDEGVIQSRPDEEPPNA